MIIEVPETIEIPDYTDTERHKELKNKVFKMASKGEAFNMTELGADEYKYYAQMWYIFRRMLKKEITPEEATEENAKAYKMYADGQALYNANVFGVIEFNDNIRKSESARVKINKSRNRQELVDAIIECIESTTGDKTMRAKIETLKEGDLV